MRKLIKDWSDTESDEDEEPRLTRNMCKCLLCGDIIESKFGHDYVVCSCGKCACDGGLNYIRRTGDTKNIQELCEYDTKNVD